MKFLIAMVLITVMLGAGCVGVIANGSTQQIQVTSVPPGANIRVDGVESNLITPSIVTLERDREHQIEVYAPAGKNTEEDSRHVFIEKKTDGGIVIADIIFTGLIGLIIDSGTGALYRLEPPSVDVYFDAVETSHTEQASTRGVSGALAAVGLCVLLVSFIAFTSS